MQKSILWVFKFSLRNLVCFIQINQKAELYLLILQQTMIKSIDWFRSIYFKWQLSLENHLLSSQNELIFISLTTSKTCYSTSMKNSNYRWKLREKYIYQWNNENLLDSNDLPLVRVYPQNSSAKEKTQAWMCLHK